MPAPCIPVVFYLVPAASMANIEQLLGVWKTSIEHANVVPASIDLKANNRQNAACQKL
jgi:hypothetical protein